MLGRPTLKCACVLKAFPAHIKHSFKQATLDYKATGRVSAIVLANVLGALHALCRKEPLVQIDATWICRALANPFFRNQKHAIRLFLEYWKDGYPALVTDEALNLLAQVQARRGVSDNVNADDPEKSWLRDDEYDDVLRATWNHYDSTGDTQTALIRLLSLQYARRPIQLSGLKFGDLKAGADKSLTGFDENEIHFPAAKERNVEIEFRGGKFEGHPIAEHLWALLLIQRKTITHLFQQALGLRLDADQVQDLPVFTTRHRLLQAARTLRTTLGLAVEHHLADELFHLPREPIGLTIAFAKNLPVTIESGQHTSIRTPPPLPISARTGKPIALNAIRLRHTRARQLARLGVPKAILSHWLGHNTDKALKFYYSDPAEQARQLDEKLSPLLHTMAQAFTGNIIASEAQATFPDDPLKRLELATNGELHSVGRCGKFSFCATTSIPVPCYRCRHFEPLVDAPHEEVLQALLYRQAQEQAVMLHPGSLRNLLVPIDLSADIRAVERCIALCHARCER